VSDEAKRPRRPAVKPKQETPASDEAHPAAPAKPARRTAASGTASRGAAASSTRGRTRPAAEPTAAVAAGTEEAAPPAKDPRPAARPGYQRPAYVGLRRRYHEEVVPALQREFGYANPMQIPRVDKVVVNVGLGEAILNAKAIDAATGDLATITGQKPIVTRAKRSIAQFRLRTGMPIGAKVTLRGQRMYDFLERTLNLALPRIRDFRGIPTRSFDGRGNFSLGLREQLVFPEIDYDSIDRLRGLEVSIITTARTDEEGRKLLQLMGMPFQSA
jgi:large subunit ribosomal protein L5